MIIQLEINRQLNKELDRKHNHIASLQSDARLLTDQLWAEQTRSKGLENDLNDLRLHVQALNREIQSLQASTKDEQRRNKQSLDMTIVELERMRDRNMQEARDYEERLIENAQRECNYFRDMTAELERANLVLEGRVAELEA